MSEPILGIDLGTTNTVVAIAEQGGVRVIADSEGRKLLPSVVSFHPSGEVLIGHAARERRLLDARSTVYSTKRLLGRPYDSTEVQRAKERFAFELTEGNSGGVNVRVRENIFSLPEISAFVLREARALAESALGEPCRKAVVTVPANFNELQRSATKAAGKIAGLDVLRIINEPTAAALAYGFSRGSRERIAIYDLGGGTFDMTILQLSGDVFEVIATAGDSFLGGDDIDALLADEMAKIFLREHRYDLKSDPQAIERLKAAAEWAKCQLSFRDRVHLHVEELAYDNGGKPLDLDCTFTQRQLESMATPLVARSFDVCDEAMRIAAVLPSQLDGVLLVGGATRSPFVRKMVQDYFEREPLMHVDPDLVVAQGAALQAFSLSGQPLRAPSQLARVLLKSTPPPRGIVEEMAPQLRHDPRSEEVRVLDLLEQSDDETGNFSRDSLVPHATPSSPGALLSGNNDSIIPALPSHTAFMPVDVDNDPFAELDQLETGARRAPDEPDTVRVAAQVLIGQAGADALSDSKPKRRAATPPPLPRKRGEIPLGGRTASGMPVVPAPTFEPIEFDALPLPALDSQSSIITADISVPPPELEKPEPAHSFIPMAEIADVRPPLLLDVTPHSLCIETVGGFCETIIVRNSAIPVEQTRVFTTARDGQTEVEAQICQGESRLLRENQGLGTIALSGLRSAPRGTLKIEVTFVLDADGTLGVRARDLETRHEQLVRIQLIGGLSEAELAAAADRQQALFAQR